MLLFDSTLCTLGCLMGCLSLVGKQPRLPCQSLVHFSTDYSSLFRPRSGKRRLWWGSYKTKSIYYTLIASLYIIRHRLPQLIIKLLVEIVVLIILGLFLFSDLDDVKWLPRFGLEASKTAPGIRNPLFICW